MQGQRNCHDRGMTVSLWKIGIIAASAKITMSDIEIASYKPLPDSDLPTTRSQMFDNRVAHMTASVMKTK